MAEHELSDDEIAKFIGDPAPPPQIELPPDLNEEMRQRFFARVAGWLVRRVDLSLLNKTTITPNTRPEFIAEWKRFVASATPEHECWEFTSPQSDWDRLAGRSGFALVLGGGVTNVIVTLLS